jgi:cytochrome c oxidase subunit 1
MPLGYLLWSLKYGARAGDNPWNAAGLEWTTPSPPPKHNFHVSPEVTTEPYNYWELPSYIEVPREDSVVGR